MTVAGSIPVYGNFTQTRFDNALPSIDSSPPLKTESAPATPVAAADIHAMQIKGRAWSLPLMRPATSGQNAETTTNRPPFADQTATALRRSANAGRDKPPAADTQLCSLLKSCEELSARIAVSGEKRQEYEGALRAINILSKALVSRQSPITQDGPPHMETEGGVIAVDLDEAIHGLYTAVAYTKNACANGFGALGEALARDAMLWANNPKAWLTQSAQPHGAADVTLAGIVTVALVPFALMALHAGISEMRESHTHGKILAQEVEHSREFLDMLNRLSSSCQAEAKPQFRNLVDAAKKAAAQQLEDLQNLQQKNRENGQIGFFSAMSGGAIAVKATLDFGAKVGGLAGGAAATTLATTVGAAGAILAPIAAASAVGLGAKMVIKSNQALKNFTPLAEHLNNRLASEEALGPLSRETAGKHDYLEFLPKKLRQRSRFFHTYAKNNKRFLFGTVLYAAGAAASFGLTVAALAGAGIVLGPIGMGILLGVSITGGLLMARYSAQFLFGHGRMHRYENYSVGKDLELDPDFLSTIETFTNKNPKFGKTVGMALRASYYEQAATRDELRQDFLGDVARNLGKRYHQALSYSTDSDEVRAKRGGPQNKWDVVCATLQKKYEGVTGYARAGMNYLDNLLRLRGHTAAKASASASRQESKPYLSVNDLQDWLHQPANHPKQIALMHRSLGAQVAFLKEKIDLRIKIYVHSNDLPTHLLNQPDGAAAIVSSASTQTANDNSPRSVFLKEMAASLARDVEMRSQAENLHAELTRELGRYSMDSSSIPEQELSKLTSRFQSLQGGLPYDPKKEIPDIRQSQASLANHYLKKASGRYRNQRGLLVETELKATRLAMQEEKGLNPRSAAGTSRRSR